MELSPQHSVGWEDEEEEEPLFADDVVNSDDDDPPPLPPPMPPLSQLSQPHTVTPHTGTPRTVRGGGGGGIGDWGDNTQGPPPADGGGSGQGEQAEQAQKKRAPILTLTIDRIFSEKGLSRIEKEFPKLKFKGKGHEAGDLCYLMQQYEHWANALYPKLTFKDVTDRIERLATKKEFKSQLIQMRRRWARGPTPPLENEDDITNNDRHDDNTSGDQHTTTDQDTALQLRSERDNGRRSDGESDNEGEIASRLSHSTSPTRDPVEPEKGEVDEYEDLLMEEGDIVGEQVSRKRERSSESSNEEQQPEDGGSREISEGSAVRDGVSREISEGSAVRDGVSREISEGSAVRDGVKRSRTVSSDDELDNILDDEEQFMHETSLAQPPPEFD